MIYTPQIRTEGSKRILQSGYLHPKYHLPTQLALPPANSGEARSYRMQPREELRSRSPLHTNTTRIESNTRAVGKNAFRVTLVDHDMLACFFAIYDLIKEGGAFVAWR